MSKSLATLRRALAGEVGMSNELEELSKSIYNGTLPEMWRRFTPATLKSLGNWMLYHLDRHTQYYTWVHEREPQVLHRTHYRPVPVTSCQPLARCNSLGVYNGSMKGRVPNTLGGGSKTITLVFSEYTA